MKNDLKYTSIESVANKLGFVKTDNHVGRMWLLDCSLWKTEYENILISDYDTTSDEDLRPKDIVCLIGHDGRYRGQQKISGEVLNDELLFNTIIKEFYNFLKEGNNG